MSHLGEDIGWNLKIPAEKQKNEGIVSVKEAKNEEKNINDATIKRNFGEKVTKNVENVKNQGSNVPQDDGTVAGLGKPKMNVEIVGLHDGRRGRSCQIHSVCGSQVRVNSILKIKLITISIYGKEEEALGCFSLENGLEKCLVGFLRQHSIKHAINFKNKLVQIVEIHCDSIDKDVRKRSYSMKGSAKAVML